MYGWVGKILRVDLTNEKLLQYQRVNMYLIILVERYSGKNLLGGGTSGYSCIKPREQAYIYDRP